MSAPRHAKPRPPRIRQLLARLRTVFSRRRARRTAAVDEEIARVISGLSPDEAAGIGGPRCAALLGWPEYPPAPAMVPEESSGQPTADPGSHETAGAGADFTALIPRYERLAHPQPDDTGFDLAPIPGRYQPSAHVVLGALGRPQWPLPIVVTGEVRTEHSR